MAIGVWIIRIKILQNRGNIAGIIAIVLWSSSALFFSYAESMPTFLLLSVTFFFGFLTFVMGWSIKSPKILVSKVKTPARQVLFPLLGIGLYNVFYYNGLKYAPIAEANIVNYMWPTFIIIFSGFASGQRLRMHVILGALICFSGICVLRVGLEFNMNDWSFELGHVLAFFAALTWGIYSVVISKLSGNSPDAVPVSFLYNAILFFLLHFFFEGIWNIDWGVVIYAIILGVMVGIAYFMWDIAMSNGDVQMLGVLSYFIPLSSTLLLVTFGYPVMTNNIMFSACIIVVGTLIASADKLLNVYYQYRRRGDV